MSLILRPLLAAICKDTKTLTYPVYATPKIDGLRCIKADGQIVSRSFKPIPNHHIRATLASILPDGMDGEVLAGNNSANFQEVVSAIMSRDGTPDFIFNVFDYVKDSLTKPYTERIKDLREWYDNQSEAVKKIVRPLYPVVLDDEEELLVYEKDCLTQGYEGVMVRRGNGPYKCGRSSEREGILLKIKRFMDSEAIIEGFEELMHNVNEKTPDAFGLSERSSQKAGMVPADTLGALLVKDVVSGISFKIGTGFDAKTRDEIWKNKEIYLGKLAKYKSFSIGVKEAPRFPVFLGIRPSIDLD